MNPCAVAIAALLALVYVPAQAQDPPVTPKEIQDTWVNKTLIGATASGAAVTLKLQPDGAASLVAGSTTDTGTWRLSEQGYCTTWKSIRAGQERCYSVRRAGAVMKVFNPDGSLSGEFKEIR